MRHIALSLLAVFLFITPATAQQVYTAEPSAQQLQDVPVLLVDIRQPQEWVETGVLPNALLLTFNGPASFLQQLQPHLQPGQPVALICRTGNRTARAAQMIAPSLDVPVIDVAGGIFRLLDAGYQPATPTRAQGCTIC
ncbi:rhodanese-like domain-containing protein [Roseinatronobacter bogoriensis]|uniref:Rhodanese-like domain-containing protein n=1 Tax=Roseinatronobacter bogoriensis subsp. barguzinensis TaxID=441209 RepID=A0A2K8KJL1_9RHOB|nr:MULTISPECIES: rhodanese-like domain-containing protein [Rhodobaca]ATX66470.1 rhodanese-like domain-containing protein [Rhodobaca barguzinensis]MBB4207618.1 rhodanese-related sulfurtransferase [Rhodobaca bogoriensis DSM 18756]TDW40075.1 rhodanese-related sulfurtransferase [Rhodobaca barguzinensis]TDY70772.1 rhodanese-related sulfurtransferase [Rhodobaca bogoriensis DSM 18756]